MSTKGHSAFVGGYIYEFTASVICGPPWSLLVNNVALSSPLLRLLLVLRSIVQICAGGHCLYCVMEHSKGSGLCSPCAAGSRGGWCSTDTRTRTNNEG